MSDEQLSLDEGLAPLADLLDRLATVAQALIPTVVPLDGSPAMVELAAEEPFRSPGWDAPVMNATSYASIAGYAAIDATKAYAHLLRHTDLFVWAPMVTARAGLDAAATAYWLIEPGVSVEQRFKRGLVYRLHNCRSQQRAPRALEEVRQAGRAGVEAVRGLAGGHSWTISGKDKHPRVHDTELARPREWIGKLLAFRTAPDFGQIPDLVWWYYSGLVHAAPYALMQSIDRASSEPTGVAGIDQAALMIDGHALATGAIALGRGLANATDAYATRLGLDCGELRNVAHELSAVTAKFLDAIDRAEAVESAHGG